jgi:serine/threonine protein kinase
MEEMALAVLPRDYDSNEQESIASNQSLPATLDKNEQGDETNNGSNIPHSKWDPRHFEFLTTLKGGTYATIYLVESSQTQQLYAMKVKSKGFLHVTSEIESINTEKALLLLAKRGKHPFVVDVFGGFQTQSHVMLYLEFCQGGDLMHHVRTGGQFGIERAR